MTGTAAYKVDSHVIQCPIYTSLVDSILVELKAPLKSTFQLFCEKANYKITAEKTLLEKELRKEMDNLLKNASVGFNYTKVQDIDWQIAESLNWKVMLQTATMMEKIQLQKYFFTGMFLQGADEQTLELVNGDTMNMMQYCWENRDMFLFKRFKTILEDPNRICVLNKLDCPFVENIKSLKLDLDIVANIFETFKFKYLTEKSAAITILKEVYNTYFNQQLIVTKKQESKSHNYIHLFPKCSEFRQKYLYILIFLYFPEKEKEEEHQKEKDNKV